jgi:ABC-type uncharacterized transport system permease subunit
MLPALLVQLALIILVIRSIYVAVQISHSRQWLDILFHISIAIVAFSFLFPHDYYYYIH